MTAAEAVLWPERYSLYDLMVARATMGEASFESEFQNNPIDPSKCEWSAKYFDYPGFYFERWPNTLALKTMFVDPSKGRESKPGDYSAIITLGRDPAGVLYVDCNARNDRDAETIVQTTMEIYRQFRADAIGFEVNGFQELFCILFRQADEASRTHTPIWAVDNRTNKQVRIRRLGTYLAQRLIRFKAGSPGVALLIEQMRDFPNGTYDDCCFVTGTMVETECGPRPIERIKPGDYVLTRFGYSRVVASGCTGVKPTLRLAMADGSALCGTHNHPVFDGIAFAPMRSSDMLWAWHENTKLPNPKSFALRGVRAIEKRNGPIAPVYNLTVEAGEYFANGFLVHNCDALEGAIRIAVDLHNGRTQSQQPPTIFRT